MSFDWQAVVRTVAPVIGTALGGPMGGVAARAVAGVLLGKDDADDAAISQAVAMASPDQLLALKKADEDFAAKMQELDVDLEKVAAGDRDSARHREMAIKDWVPGVLAILVTLGFFGVLSMMLTYGAPESGRDALLVLIGSLGAAFTSMLSYYYGSSTGSKQKTELMATMGK